MYGHGSAEYQVSEGGTEVGRESERVCVNPA